MSKELLAAFRNCAAAWSFAGLVAGCASVPEFKPSRPIAQAAGFHEGAFLCHEYRIAPERSRPVAMRPYLYCIDELTDRGFGDEPSAFGVFRDELHLLYDLQREEAWDAETAREIDEAIQAALKGFWRGPSQAERYGVRERRAVLAYFPRTAERLDALNWKVEPDRSAPRMDLELERAKALAGRLGRDDRSRAIRAELRELDSYQGDLARLERLAPGDPRLERAGARYRERVREMVRRMGEHAGK